MITNNERQDSPELVLKAVADSLSTGLRVAMPGIIQSFDADAVTATIQPAVKASVRQADGTVASVALPLLVDVPVEFPRGGGVTLTFPIKPGDDNPCT